MKEKELVDVYIRMNDGKIACICLRSNKKCTRDCPEDVVEHDRFRDWEKTMRRDVFGRTND